jgi:hypothetical protein
MGDVETEAQRAGAPNRHGGAVQSLRASDRREGGS